MEAYDEILTPLPNGFMLVERGDLGYELSLSTKVVAQLGQCCRSPRSREGDGM